MSKVKCLDCGDVIESKHRHDFRSCSCGKVSIDGGRDYKRMVYEADARWIDLPDDPKESE